jgi:hypothetical protein
MIVTYDSEKLAAMRQYAAKRDVSVEDELAETIGKLYEKLVPAPVREYIENKPEGTSPSRPARPSRARPAPAQPDGGG